jgi:hypothetical protein
MTDDSLGHSQHTFRGLAGFGVSATILTMRLSDIFERFGLPVEAFARIRAGRGAVGRTAQVMIVALIVLGSIAFRVTDERLLMIAGAAIILFVMLVLRFLLTWAERNPELAVMEGLDLAAYRQADLESKNQLELNPLPPTTDPRQPPPTLPGTDDE